MVSRAVRLCGTELVDPPMRTLTRRPALGRVRQRRAALHPLRRRRGAARHRLPGPRRELGHLHAHDRGPARRRPPTTASRSPIAPPAPTPARTLVYDATITGSRDGSLGVRGRGRAADRRADQPHRLHRPAPGRRRRRPAGDDPPRRRPRGAVALPRGDRPRAARSATSARSRHEIAPGTWATCTMEGDAFEMEDQRNWSDASYKTYVRPLARPWPYTLPKGEPVAQSVTARDLRRPRLRPRPRTPARVRVAIGGEQRQAAGDRHRRSGRGGRACARGRRPARAPRARAGSPARSTSAAATAAPSSAATAPSPS